MSEASFGEIFTTYYQSPAPARAVAALEAEAPRDPGVLNKRWRTLEIYFFSTIAHEYQPIVHDYEALFDRQPSRLVLDVLAQTGDEGARRFINARLADERFRTLHHQMRELVKRWPTKRIDPLATPARTALDLDLLWAQFLVTGRTTSVERIIDVLEWPDLVRQRVESALRLPGVVRFLGASLTWPGGGRLSVTTGVIRRMGIEVDRQRRVVETPEDLDTRFLTPDGSLGGEAWSLISPSLFKKEREKVATKAAARWSLGANAMEHPRVLETCEAGSATRSGRAKLALLEISAVTRLSRGDRNEASALARQSLELNPANKAMRSLFDRATLPSDQPQGEAMDDSVGATSHARGAATSGLLSQEDQPDPALAPFQGAVVPPEATLDDVRAILERYKDDPVVPLSALGADRQEVRNMLARECLRRLADPSTLEAWRAEHEPTTPLPGFAREPRKAWRARRSLAERALVELEKFVPDTDAQLVRHYLEARPGRAAPMEAAERERARSILKTIRQSRREAHRHAVAEHHDTLLWGFFYPRPLKGLLGVLYFMGLFLITWTIWFGLALGRISPGDFVFPGHPWGDWIALFAAGWFISTVVPLAFLDDEAVAGGVLLGAVTFFPAIVAFIEVGLLRLLGWL